MFSQLAQKFLRGHRRFVELHALVAITFSDFLRPHEHPGEDALWAGVAAPHATGEYGNKKQAEGGDDQQRGEQDEILRPIRRAKDIKLALRQVPPDGLTAVPGQPYGAEVQQEEGCATEHTQVAENAGEGAGVDFFAVGVQVNNFDLGRGRGDVFNWNLCAHQFVPRRLIGCPGRYVPAGVIRALALWYA